jgi:hypothetical protein
MGDLHDGSPPRLQPELAFGTTGFVLVMFIAELRAGRARTEGILIMVSIMKPTIALAFAAAVGAASPAFAQAVAIEGPPHPSAVGFPFAYVNAAGPSGQCWIMTDKGMGYGYWGTCPEGVAVAPAPSRRTQATSARAAVQAPPASATGTIAVGGPQPAIDNRTTVRSAAPAPATSASAFVAPAPAANRESFPFAYVNSPAPDGQCWMMTDKSMGYGYWGKCP